MKTHKVHRNSTDALTVVAPSGSAQLAVPIRSRHLEKNEGRSDDPSFRGLENFKMALLFNQIQGRSEKSK